MRFDEFIGNTRVLERLRQKLRERRFPHALIFAGPEGVGKRTCALLLAKALNCAERGPEENEVSLDRPIPVHITYFTARVGEDGEIESFGDIYGHEKRITLALQGKWNQIDVTKEPKVTPDDMGFDEDADSRRSNDDDWFGVSDNDDRRRRGKKYDGGLNNFFQKVLGGL